MGLSRSGRIKRYYHDGLNAKFVLNGLMPPHPGLVIKRTLLTELDAFGKFDIKIPHDFWICVKLVMKKNISCLWSDALCIHMESGGLSTGFFYSMQRIYRQKKVLKFEGIRRSTLKIVLFKFLKLWKYKTG